MRSSWRSWIPTRHMARRFGWLSGFLFLVLGCVGDSTTAPGSCPVYCTTAGSDTRDTLFTAAVRGDSSYRGYFYANSANEIQVAGPGGASEARGILHFARFPMRYQVLAGDTTTSVIQ